MALPAVAERDQGRHGICACMKRPRVDVLSEALQGEERIRIAFVFVSLARGEGKADSDVDRTGRTRPISICCA